MPAKKPPLAKMYEAYTAIADSRVAVSSDSAAVRSSDGAKTYTVKWRDNYYCSDDNATYWQSYPGYPVIAVLLIQQKITADPSLVALFKGINWHQLNKQYKNDYQAAAAAVLDRLDPALRQAAAAQAQANYQTLLDLDIIITRKL